MVQVGEIRIEHDLLRTNEVYPALDYFDGNDVVRGFVFAASCYRCEASFKLHLQLSPRFAFRSPVHRGGRGPDGRTRLTEALRMQLFSMPSASASRSAKALQWDEMEFDSLI